MKSVQTVYVGNADIVSPQNGCQLQQAHGFGPKIIRCEIMNPWIDKQEVGIVFSQVYIILG